MMALVAPLGLVEASVVRLWSTVAGCVPIVLVTRTERPGTAGSRRAAATLTAAHRFLDFPLLATLLDS